MDNIENNNREVQPPVSNSNEYHSFNSFYYLALIYRYKLLIIIAIIVVTGVTVFFVLQMPNWYSSTINVVPPKGTGSLLESAVGNISSAIKKFGLTKLGGSEGEGNYTYMVILESQTVKDSIIKKYNLQKEYGMEDAKMSEVRDAFDDNLEINVGGEGNYTVSIMDKDRYRPPAMLKDYILFANNHAQYIAHEEAKVESQYLVKRISQINDAFTNISDSLVKFSKKYGVFMPEEQATAVTKAMSELKAELIKQEIGYEMLSNRYGPNDPYTLMQKDVMDELKKKVNQAETQPGFAGNFKMNQAASVGIEFLRLYSELETFTKVKAFLLPMLEEAKLNEVRYRRNLFIVDNPIPADKKSKPKRSFYVLGAGAGTIVLSILIIIVSSGFKSFKKKYRELGFDKKEK